MLNFEEEKRKAEEWYNIGVKADPEIIAFWFLARCLRECAAAHIRTLNELANLRSLDV